jgi:ribosomal protein S12 methylthiotransferase
MLGVLKRAGHSFVSRPDKADVIIVNTCGFIQPARDEALETLERVLRIKRRDPRKTVVAAGCYVERDEAELRRRFPEVDVWTGVRSFDRVADLIGGRRARPRLETFLYSDRSPRLVSTPPTWAYVKVSEGCSHRCGFCSIPSIKGHYVSRSLASIVREARALADRGVREINLVSHDTTFFGRDRGLKDGLVRLIDRLLPVRGLEWIRVLYGCPEEITEPLLRILSETKVCRYLDIPFQHADPKILRTMKRGMDGARALDLLKRIRERVPGVALRTSLIVGFPGEGRREFRTLMRFVERANFDHLGVFVYSPEVGTDSFRLPETIKPGEKEGRRAEVMALQADLSSARNQSTIGRVLDVLAEEPASGGRALLGRTRAQAPEVDGRVRVSLAGGARWPRQPIVKARIVAAGPYDLRGELVS